MVRIVFTDCNVIDVEEGCRVMPDCDIYVEDGKIAKICPHGMVPQGWKVEDMKGAYAAPGLVNMHVHLFGTGAPSKILAGGKAQTAVLKFVHTPLGKAVLGLLVQSAAKKQLYSGVTTLRAVGDFCNSDIALKRKTARGKGSARGLKMLVSGPAITVTGGHGAGTFAVYADDPKELEKLVDVNVGAGADFIKICVTGGVMDAKRRGEPGELKMSAEQVKAVCDRAHAHGKIVAAHVESRQGVEVAALNGVDTIEHGALMSGEAVAAMKARKGAFVTTYSPALPYCKLSPEITKLNEDSTYNSQIVLEGMRDSSRQAYAEGIAVGMGTDSSCPFCTQYDFWREVVYFHKVGGFTPEQALSVATIGNAKILGLGGVTGSLKEGKCADIVFTDRNPVEDLTALGEIRTVVASGRVIRNPKIKRNAMIKEELDQIMREL